MKHLNSNFNKIVINLYLMILPMRFERRECTDLWWRLKSLSPYVQNKSSMEFGTAEKSSTTIKYVQLSSKIQTAAN